MTVWSAIEKILNENQNIMINIETTHRMRSCLSITMLLIDPQTLRSIYKIRRIVDYKGLRARLEGTKYEDNIAKLLKNMCLEMKTKMKELEEVNHDSTM